mgnify:CR=1 FL=1
MKKITVIFAVVTLFSMNVWAMGSQPPKSDVTQGIQQEQLAAEANAQAGMPAIKNFQEKMLFELRDQVNLPTMTYLWSDLNGVTKKLCDSFGYGLPYAVQYTNPQKIAEQATYLGYAILPQADPNALFMPESADATWVMCQNPAVPSDVIRRA